MATSMVAQKFRWEKIDAKTETLKTRPMPFQKGWGEAIVRRSTSGKTYSADATLYGQADGPLVFDVLQNNTNMDERIRGFLRTGCFSKLVRFNGSACMPLITHASHDEAVRFAEFIIDLWDEFLSSYPDRETMHEWKRGLFERPAGELPPWIPESFRKRPMDTQSDNILESGL